jgi:hypothetical protein
MVALGFFLIALLIIVFPKQGLKAVRISLGICVLLAVRNTILTTNLSTSIPR